MARRVRLKKFEVEAKANKWARDVDYARQFNRLPLLEVEADKEEGCWWVVNPDADAPAYLYTPKRTPLLRGT